MERINRTAAPDYMTSNYKKWGKQFDTLKRRNPSASFQWYIYNGARVNTLILPLLQNMTNFRCSFCDVKGLEEGDQEPTIEHFKPSSKFPLLSHFWHNLFPCCYSCQKKGNNFSKLLLKPDRQGYSFDEYFFIDWSTGALAEKQSSPDVRFFQAKKTIELYGLNKSGRKKARLRELRKFEKDTSQDLEDFSYRFFISRAYL